MATKPLVGGYDYFATLAEMKTAAEAQRQSLQRLMQSNVGENQRTVYLSKIIYELTTIYKGLSELERIGQSLRAERTGE